MPEIVFEVSEGVATITLNRPDRGNALNDEMRPLIRNAWNRVDADTAIAVAIVTGAGDRHFCTGADVARLKRESGELDPETLRLRGPGGWSSRHFGVAKPVICAVNGVTAGGGLHFVADADIVLATENATFTDTHVSIGQVGALENIALTHRLPLGQVLRMALMGKFYRLGAARAYQLGLVDELFSTREAMLAAAKEMAQAMRSNSPRAMMLSKQAIWQSLESSYSKSLEQGWELICDQRNHPDAKEGPAAFAERRTPHWIRE